MMGKTIARVDLRRAFGVLVLAVHRHGVNLKEKLQSTVLQYGDTLLLEGTETAIKRLRESRDLIVLGEQPHLLPLKLLNSGWQVCPLCSWSWRRSSPPCPSARLHSVLPFL